MPSRPIKVRAFALLVALFLGWHGFATAAAIATSKDRAAIVEVPGGRALEPYVQPMLGQDWMVFAPNPGNADVTLSVRSRAEDGLVSEWFNITEADVARSIRHKLVPSRLYLTNFKLVDRHFGKYRSLPESSRAIADRDYLHQAWVGDLTTDLRNAEVRARESDIREYMLGERAVATLGSAVARTKWGPDTEAIQIRIVFRPVPPYSERNNPDYVRESTVWNPGWRAVLPTDGVSDAEIRRMYGGGSGVAG